MAVAIVKRHYVDDYHDDSVDTVEEAIQRASEVKYVHPVVAFTSGTAGFELGHGPGEA